MNKAEIRGKRNHHNKKEKELYKADKEARHNAQRMERKEQERMKQ